jgi:hypothetical protein
VATSQEEAGLPIVTLAGGSRLVLEAISPTTGAQVAGVAISGVTITYEPDTEPDKVPLPPALLAYAPGPN